jgi:RNA polymerase sigma factor (sigma-70 family)
LNEGILIEQLKRGEDQAYQYLIDHWQDMVFNTALGIVQQRSDAEDITQEVFVQAFRSVGTFKGESKLSTWLYRICISKALDHERRRKRKKRFALVKTLFGDGDSDIADPDHFDHPGIRLENKEKAATLFRAVAKLPDNQRIAFTLNKLEGLAHGEIAEVMGITVSAVESLLHRAKANLRKWLEDFYRENG